MLAHGAAIGLALIENDWPILFTRTTRSRPEFPRGVLNKAAIKRPERFDRESVTGGRLPEIIGAEGRSESAYDL